MNFINKIIIGSGISSFVYYKNNPKKIKVFSNPSEKVFKSGNFYEYDKIGGNSNIWGGYINLKRHKKFLKNKKYRNFVQKKFFNIKKIFKNNPIFENTYCLTSKNNNLFRIKKSFFKNNLIEKKICKINIQKNKIILTLQDRKTVQTNKLILCVGNLNLLKLLHESNLIRSKDVISFDDSSCNYVLNIFKNPKINYYIPMPVKQILEKLIFQKSKNYQITGETVFLQKFSKIKKKYNLSCESILKNKKYKLRYFLSNHLVNLKVNNIPIRKFIKRKTNKIDIYCSGTVKKYLPGPVVQDLIFDILTNE